MHTSMEKLMQLQDVLAEKHHIEHRLKELPKQLATKQEVLTKLNKNLEQKLDVFSTIDQKVRILRLQLIESQNVRENAEKRMALVKTQREFELLEKEIQDAVSEEEKFRQELAQESIYHDSLKSEIDQDKELISVQENELIAGQADIESTANEENLRLQELEIREKNLSQNMSTDLLYKFETIVRNKNGLGIVPLRGGICRGCFIVLPAQFVNSVRLEKDVEFCPSCSRILFYEEGGQDFSQIMFDTDDIGGLADLLDDDDSDEEDNVIIYPEMAGEFEDN